MDAEKAFWLFVIFTAVVFLTGGGSRYDIESVGALRAFSAVVLAVALFFQSGKSLRRIAVPLAILGALAVWMVLQLVPLPPSIWTALPGREAIAGLGELTGMTDIWRPITFSPLKTANSLASLVVPVAALALLALLDDKGWKRLPWVFIFAGVASAAFGIAQRYIAGGEGLYLYEITNRGSAVGLFSNRNHNAIFLTIALLFSALRIEGISRSKFGPMDLVAILAAFVLFSGILINASRTGLVGLGVVGLIFGVRAMFQWRKSVREKTGGGTLRLIVGGVVGVVSLIMVGLFTALGRSPAIERLLEQDPAEDQRLQSLSQILGMLRDFQPFGVGFGAFEQAYRTIEPEEFLQPRYLNNAHNDWLQFPIEGGVPAIVIGVAAIAMLVMRVVRVARLGGGSDEMVSNAWLGIMVVGILALGSMVDYPLRTPSLMLLAATAIVMMFKPIAVGRNG